MGKKEKIKNKAVEFLNEKNLLLIDFVWRGSDNFPVIELFIDGKESVTVDTCYDISRKLENFIDDEAILKKYRLDVSSPGVDRPLKYIEQYFKHIGREFEIDFLDSGKEITLTGKLLAINNLTLIFERNEKTKEQIEINFDKIKKAKVLISFL